MPLDRQMLRALARVSTIGINLVVYTFVGLIAGHYLDKWTGLRPVFTITLLLCGIAGGLYDIFRQAKEQLRQDD